MEDVITENAEFFSVLPQYSSQKNDQKRDWFGTIPDGLSINLAS